MVKETVDRITVLSRARSSLRAGLRRYERHLGAALLLLGAYFDVRFLPRIDEGVTYILLSVYLALTALMVVASAALTEHASRRPLVGRLSAFLDLAIPFFIGSLLSAVFVYYSRSSSLFESFPFLTLLLFVMLLSELVRDRLKLLELRVALLYFILVMDIAFAVPVFVGSVGTLVFIFSALCALFIMLQFLVLLAAFAPSAASLGRNMILASILGITLFINLCYFFRIIPPIPLALRVAEVSYGISRANGSYLVIVPSDSANRGAFFSVPTVMVTDAPLYFFSAVFAPIKLETTIVHAWQFYDDATSSWVTKRRIGFLISGGRDSGYRGYSSVSVSPGEWRVRVETDHGEVLGVERFNVILGMTPDATETRVR